MKSYNLPKFETVMFYLSSPRTSSKGWMKNRSKFTGGIAVVHITISQYHKMFPVTRLNSDYYNYSCNSLAFILFGEN